MNTRPLVRALALGAVLLPAALLATGCSSLVDRVLYKEIELSFDDRDALVKGWDQEAPWVPADASHITGTASVDGTNAAVLLRSDADLDPELCAETSRRSAPVYALTDAPAVYEMDTVFACGDWSVVATDDGWLGWTPNHPEEAAASPAA
ncbi:hypothetical protein [Streptomyces sp. AC495_CC817]|uniref:hypothetical protein n=1 Tax=Streptomyces sp. AC495_CC817 TaxID=2823900 RepID=UPI001C277715|nr:hypothetical protein [Streptomyces sp. AC495_CC817]